MRTFSRSGTRGVSLAKGPALVLGSILLAFGLAALPSTADFPPFADLFPDGEASGDTFLGFELNGWTAALLIGCGGLLLFGVAQHLLAKTMSLLVGLVLAAATIWWAVDGDIAGAGAANGWTALGTGIAAGLLLLNVLMPRRDATTTEPRTAVVGPTPAGERSERFARDREPAPRVHDDATA